ncbi:MAG: sialidase family protein [Candidatus Cybelea sp.]
MANTQVTFDGNPNNARCESSIAINPNDSTQIVAASKKFNNIQTYDFTLATEYSTDGGQSWHDSAALGMPGFTVMTDPTMAWDDQGSIYLVGLAGKNPPTWDTIGIVIYKSNDGGKTWSAPNMIHQSTGDDKQWCAADTNSAAYKGRVYAVWDDNGNIDFARTKDHGATWVGAGAAPQAAGSPIISDGSVYPEIDISDDGTIYIVSLLGNEIVLHVSTDGGDTFTSAASPATGITSLQYALPAPQGFPSLPGGTFRVLTDPTACVSGEAVMVAWADYREGVSRIYYARSEDGGTTWLTPASGQALLTSPLSPSLHHFHPQVVTDPSGVIGCSFYEFGPKPTTALIDVIVSESFDGGATFNHFTVTDQPWNPTVDAPWSHGNSSLTFIGDYFGLDASARGFIPLWTDTRTGIQELFTTIAPERNVGFIINRSTIGQDEVDARRKLAGGASAVVPDAFRVVVDGFKASQLGATGPGSTLTVASPIAGMTITCTGNVSDNGDYGPEVQRFTFDYNIDFGSDPTDPAFASPTEFLTLSATVEDLTGNGEIELIKQPDPFMLHGDPAWLSVDLRVFVMRPNQKKFGVQMGADASAAPSFIQHAAKALTNGGGSAGGDSFDDPAVLSPDEEGSALYLYPEDDTHTPVFNFALARVRYIGLIGATDVRVFFRLFAAQTTTGEYDYPPGYQYRRATSNPDGEPIPLAGITGDDYVTVPFFALPRIDTTTKNMDKQTDAHKVNGVKLGNVQTVTAHGDGSEVDTFFGCWLDINQAANVIPASKDTVHPDGPFQSISNPPLPIQQAMFRNLHQCLIAEVAFDPVTIPLGKDPSNWDKLAQRNLAWSDVGSATATTTFEVKPTTVGLPSAEKADELMIDWGRTPKGSIAKIYLPAVSADEILDMSSRMYVSNRLTKIDDHTVQCRTGGTAYIPIPARDGASLTGLLTIDLPEEMSAREAFTVVVRQVTNAFGAKLRTQGKQPVRGRARTAKGARVAEPTTQEGEMGRSQYDYLYWRRVSGAFQLTVPVKPKQSLLLPEQRHLSLLRWIGEAIPVGSRWYPVFERYLDVIAGRLIAFGGDPKKVGPSHTGWITPVHVHPPERHGDDDDRCERTGKVAGLIYDRYGDFDGFILKTEDGEWHYRSRERDVADLAARAWRERLLLTVYSDRHDSDGVERIVIWEPPAPFCLDAAADDNRDRG